MTVLAFKKVLVPESVEHIHADYIRALELVEEMVPLMSAAIMELNVYKLEQAFDLVDESSVFIGSAADKKEAYCLQKFFEAMAEESN